jgi:hypothetical protein
MKRSDFKAIVKECLVEILRDNMELFTESPISPSVNKKRQMRGNATRPQKNTVKRSLRNLVQEQERRPSPQPRTMSQHPQQQQQQRRPQLSGSPTVQDMILSAASTMTQQNSNGEMSSRSIGMGDAMGGMQQQQMQPMNEGYSDYAAYGNSMPIPSDPGMGGMMPPMPIPSAPAPDMGGAVDGNSHWAQLAFFDS